MKPKQPKLTAEQVGTWIKKFEANIVFIKGRIDQQNETQVTGRKYFPYELEEEQFKIDYLKEKYKHIIN